MVTFAQCTLFSTLFSHHLKQLKELSFAVFGSVFLLSKSKQCESYDYGIIEQVICLCVILVILISWKLEIISQNFYLAMLC